MIESEQNLEGEKGIEKLFDAVLLDWDGVLYDSMDNIGRAAIEVAKHFGIHLDLDEFKRTYEQPYWDYYESIGIPASTKEQQEYIYRLYHDEIMPELSKHPSQTPNLYPEAPDILRSLKERGLTIAIISAHKPDQIKDVLEKSGVNNFVDFVIGLAHNKKEATRQFCEDHGFSPERVLALGDLPSDLRDARKAGVKVAGVARFADAEKRLGSYEPDFLFRSIGPEILYPKSFEINR